MANWSLPNLGDLYQNVLNYLKDRDLDLAKGMDPAKVTVTNPVADMLRWSSASSKWQRYDGSAWVDMAGTYGIRVTSADVLATARTIALSGGATGAATSFNGSANITIPITGLNMGNATAGILSVDRGGTGTATATGGGDLVRNNSPTLIAPIVGTAAAGTDTQVAASCEFVNNAIQSSSSISANATGTANAIAGVFSPAITALSHGMTVRVRAGSANTSATPTFQANDNAYKTIVKGNNLALAVGDIAGAGHWLELQYDATLDKWILQNPAKGVSVVTYPNATEAVVGVTRFATWAEVSSLAGGYIAIPPAYLGDGVKTVMNAVGSAPIYAVRAWVSFNGVGTGTAPIFASGNVSSVTHLGTGNYVANLTTALPDTNFAAVVSCKRGDTYSDGTATLGNASESYSTTAIAIRTQNIGQSSAVAFNMGRVNLIVVR